MTRRSAADRTLPLFGETNRAGAKARGPRSPRWRPFNGESKWLLMLGKKELASIVVERNGSMPPAFIVDVKGERHTCWSMAEAATWAEYRVSQ